jgi:hypothetical protein
MRKPSRLALCLSCLSPLVAASSLDFSGTLERVGERSISIRLADRRIIDALDSDTETLAAEYRFGDLVEIDCTPVSPVWEADTARYQSLRAVKIRLVRRPSPEELARLEAQPFREGANLLQRENAPAPTPAIGPGVDAPGRRQLAEARRVNLDYAANMPNFVADETAKRYRAGPKNSRLTAFDTIESEITFRGNHAVRKQIRRNGQPWDKPFEALPGFKWYEGFGTEIRPLFDPQCPTTLEYRGRHTVRERQAVEYRFTTPVDSCFPYFYFEYQRFNPARTGHVFIDGESANILQLDEDATSFPAEIQFKQREEHITWDYVKIGDDSHLLPIRADFEVRYYDGTHYRIEVEYKNHRHFESSTSLKFP